MNDALLHYYNRELGYLRQLGGEFAEAHPKIAGRLRLGADTVEDPHVSRLIESVAFLNARVRAKIEDEFPELTDAILGILYPHYLAPIPSMSIVRFECDPGLTSRYDVPRGTALQTDRAHGTPCRYQTAYPVEVWPIELRAADLSPTPFEAPPAPWTNESVAVLRLELRPLAADESIASFAPERLRFHLRGTPQLAHALYELLFTELVGVAVAGSAQDSRPALLAPDCLRPVGFEADEALVPFPERAHPGYRLLSEYFAFQQKFLFFDVLGLPAEKLAGLGNKLELYLYLGRSRADLEQSVDAKSFALGCTPIVNLFQRRAEPIRLTNRQTQYRIEPDARRPLSTEVHTVEKVTAVSPSGERKELLPYFGLGHGLARDEDAIFWYARREAAPPAPEGHDEGTDVHLRLVDPEFDPSSPGEWILNVELSCTNRDLPSKLPFGHDQPIFQFTDGGGPISAIRCLTPPTAPLRPPQGRAIMWRLISHLCLNHLSLADPGGSPGGLRELLAIYDVAGSAEHRSVIAGILKVWSRPVTMQVLAQGLPGVARGTEVRIEFDPSRYVGSGLYLFASVLERFLGGYCSVNSFVQLVATVRGQEGEFARWAPRAGDRSLI